MIASSSGRRTLQVAFAAACAAVGAWPGEPPAAVGSTLADLPGLLLWLDAARIAPADRSVEPDGTWRLERWRDASGRGHDAVPPDATARPTVLADDADVPVAIRFDGLRECLAVAGPEQPLVEWTAVLVARPLANPGGFRGLLAAQQPGHNDYVSGFTIDLGPGGTSRFDVVNVEGRGFGGARDVSTASFPMGTAHVITARVRSGADGVAVWIDGQPVGTRDKEDGVMRIDRLLVGARSYDNSGAPPSLTGFFPGDIAAVALFDRALDDHDRWLAEAAVVAGHLSLLREPPQSMAGTLIPEPIDAARMLAPGFVTDRLPVDLPNVNAIRYRHDGVLVAGGYDGTVWLLRDADGDGLEETVQEYFRSPTIKAVMGMALTPPGDPRGDGVFVATVGRIVFLPDRDGDGRGDEELIVAANWEPARLVTSGVSDAMGLAVGPDGSVWFGLGTSDFTNAYLLDESGRAAYRRGSERGTIQRVSADFRTRETICSGVRFPYGLAFDAAGDLWCTDQEGATWLPNGNPHDELLLIQRDRHYGFPPRHPRHLPDVVDEPSVIDFRPQHQSTCGLCFDEPAAGAAAIFGPDWWRGDALVCGASRGRLFRAEVAKAAAGPVGRVETIGFTSMLAIDAAVSPRGDLVVSCHGGGPDWGTGPAGKGTLLRIRRQRPWLPLPRLAWAPLPGEVHIVFDRPVDPGWFVGSRDRTRVTSGRSVAAGDRFEPFRPGYAVVDRQQADPRRDLGVTGVHLAADLRTVIISTTVDHVAEPRAVTLAVGGPAAAPPDDGRVDLAVAPHGLAASWSDATGAVRWQGWLPHPDTTVARRLTAGSPQHDDLWRLVEAPGRLRLESAMRLESLSRPEVQRDTPLDHTPSAETVGLTVTGPLPRTLVVGDGPATDGAWTGAAAARVPIVIEARTGPGFALDCGWHVPDDGRSRPMPLERYLMPWTVDAAAPPPLGGAPELVGGDWGRGWRLFFGSEAGCATCHRAHGRGGWVGPDLTNLVHRDVRSVRRDIEQPGAVINPDSIAHHVETTDGRVLTGIVRPEGDAILVGDAQGIVQRVPRDAVAAMEPAAVSIMPTGLAEKLGPAAMRDLLTFLTTPPPRMTDYGPLPPPPPRTRAEVADLLAGGQPAQSRPRPLRLLLVVGPKDHGPGEHDYPAWGRAWRDLLGLATAVEATVVENWPTPEQFARADGIVVFQQGQWTPSRAAGLDAFLDRGGGGVFIHYAVDGGGDPSGFAERIGLAWQGGRSRFRHGPLELSFAPAAGHPIARNLDRVAFHDESYWDLVAAGASPQVLATAEEDGAARPLMWTAQRGRGRVVVSIPGHYSWTFDDPVFRTILLRGVAWSVGEDVDRFADLVTIGSRIVD